MHVQELQFQFFFLHAPVANSTMHADSTERLHTLMPQALSLFKLITPFQVYMYLANFSLQLLTSVCWSS